MSGIAGSFGFGADTEGIARRMSSALEHRGPDGDGLFVDGHTGLAHRRVAALDSEPGAQPMTSADGRFTLVHDGAPHPRAGLRAELEGRGHSVRTATELLLAAHADGGSAAYDRFDGAFAVAVHDARSGTLTLARDHFGIAPLYYWIDETPDAAAAGHPRVLFGSEIRALLAAQCFDPVPDDRAVHRYLVSGAQDDDPRTFFRGVRRLMPGQVLEIGPEGTEVTGFTRLPEELREIAAAPGRPYGDEVVEEFRDLFGTSVRRCLVSEGPVGTLSGDLGSAAVAAEVARQLREQPGDGQLGAVGPRLHTVSTVAGSRPAGLLEDLRDLVRTQEEPIGSPAPYGRYAMMREASEQVTVLLDGQGAEEMVAGSAAHLGVHLRQLRRQKRFRELAGQIAGSRGLLRERARTAASGPAPVPIQALLNSGFVAAHSSEQVAPVPDDLRQRLLQDVFRDSLPAQLRYEDKNAARFGLQARLPFVDRDLLRFLVSLDESAFLSGGRSQRILRDALDGDLPSAIAAVRDDAASAPPEGEWLRTSASEVREIFASESFASRPYFDAPTVVALFDDGIAHPGNHGTDRFWRLLNVELWLRTFIDGPAGTVAETAPAAEAEPEESKSDYVANPGKQLDLLSEADGHSWRRLPLQTELVGRGDALEVLVRERVERFAAGLPEDAVPAGAPWYFVISEKIVAITQGRSWFTWEVAPRPAARVLSRFVTRTPAGIGLGDPTTMELAIREVGLPRVLAASVAGAAGKLVRRKGLFYEVVGANVRAIDGPTPYSAFPSNVSAKLPPKDPDDVSAKISAALRGADLPAALQGSFVGTVVMDANDIGRNVLGSDVAIADARLEATFADNPLGQGRQRTPMAILVDLGPAPRR